MHDVKGYARVSTRDQDTEAQIAALEKSGCELIFMEKASGARWERPELHRLLGQLRKGDVLVVWTPRDNKDASVDAVQNLRPTKRRRSCSW